MKTSPSGGVFSLTKSSPCRFIRVENRRLILPWFMVCWEENDKQLPAAFRSFTINGRQIVTGLFHHSHHLIKRDAVTPIRIICKGCTVQGPQCSKGISLDTRNLYQSINRIASKSEVMFQTHLGRIFDLMDRSTQQLHCAGCRHGTS